MFQFLKGINDLTNTHYPYYILLKRELLENHRFPIINPMIFGGYNLLGDPQNGIIYPFTYLYLFLNLNLATIFLFLSHFALLFAGTFLIFRKIFKAERLIAIFMSLLFVFLPKWSYHITAGHLSMIESMSWFPIIFYYILKITKEGYKLSRKDLILFSAACCLSIFANYFFFYQIALFVGVYLILWLVTKIKNRKSDQIITVVRFIFLSSVISLLVTGVQVISGLTAMKNLTHINLSLRDTIPFWSWKYLFQGIFSPYKNLVNFNQETFLYSGILFYIFVFWGIIKSKFSQKNIFLWLILFFLIFIVNYKFPFYGIFIRIIPGTETLRVTTRFWFFICFLLLIFLYQCFNASVQNKKIIYIVVFIILCEYLLIDGIKFTSTNIYGDQKEGKIHKYLAKNYKNKKIYTTGAFLSQYFTASYNIRLVAGENPWQNKSYIEKLKKAGGFPWFNEYAVIYPPWVAEKTKAQPNAKLLCEMNGEVVLSKYDLKDSAFKYVSTVDKIKIYENPCPKH